jgi:hypothetical protein
MSRRSGHLVTGVAIAAFAIVATGACGSSDLLVGDDTRDLADGATSDNTNVFPDSPLPDASKDTGLDARDDVTCPQVSPPAPGFCDGGPVATKYNPNGCVSGFVCAPVACADAGGTCVGLAPGSCPSNQFGDATKYTCGGIGVGCCLP